MRNDGAVRPHGAADGSGALEGAQLGGSSGALLTAAALAVGWAALACAQGGIDLGVGRPSQGQTSALLALLVLPPAAAWLLWAARRRLGALGGPALLAVGGLAGLVAWSGASIAWSAAPDLSWIETDRTALALAAMVAGLAFGLLVAEAPALFALGLSLACVPVIGWALVTKAFTLQASALDEARLALPLGVPNALALVAVVALPGTLWAAGRGRRTGALSAAGAGALLLALLLTSSRSGVIALAAALLVVAWLTPGVKRSFAALIAGAVGMVPAGAYALTAHALTTDGLSPAARRGAGLVLGALILLGMALAALLFRPTLRAARRLGAHLRPRRRAGLAIAAALVALLLAGGIALAATSSDPIGSGSTHLVSASSNHRSAWWGQAARGFERAPIRGHGAGSFPVTRWQDRRDGCTPCLALQPHQLELQLLSEQGIAGLALLVATFAGVGWAALRARRRGAPAVGLPLAVVVAFLAQNQLDWSWSIPALSVAAFAAAGVVLSQARGPAPARILHRAPFAIGLAALALAAAGSAVVVWLSEQETKLATDALFASHPVSAVSRAGHAQSLNPLSVAPLLVEAAAQEDLGRRAAALEAARAATATQPANPRPWECRWHLAGATPEGARARARVFALDPYRDPNRPPATCGAAAIG